MQSRGGENSERLDDRPAIARRSCDQCRARKIGCDRNSPCSNCTSARLNCTHSAASFKPAPSKQRVLISAQYEKKIDDIARGIDNIKLLLNKHQNAPDAEENNSDPFVSASQNYSAKRTTERGPAPPSSGDFVWDHSAHIIDFIKAVVKDSDCNSTSTELSNTRSSLKKVLVALENPSISQEPSFKALKATKNQADCAMPPLDAVVAILRWARDHAHFNRIVWITQILPLETFKEICRKIYFAVDDYNDIDFILANAFLTYTFCEHVVTSGLRDYREFCQLCRNNLQRAFSRLPLLLPASTEVIAALAFGAFSAIQNSKATVGWTFVSTAAHMCQTLGYHRERSLEPYGDDSQSAQNDLFWTIYILDRSLSLRLGRSPIIPDAEITLQPDPSQLQRTRLARIQGKIYDRLYSSTSLSQPIAERYNAAEALATELQHTLEETRLQVSKSIENAHEGDPDITRQFYQHCDLVCQSSILTLVLRAFPSSSNGASEECIAAARSALDEHQRCMTTVKACRNDPFMVMTYLNWSIQHVPFVPFSILYKRTIQLLDFSELERLDRFASSLKTETAEHTSITHPGRLYELLCQTARVYLFLRSAALVADDTSSEAVNVTMNEFDIVNLEAEADDSANQSISAEYLPITELSDWFYSNQQFMGLLDDNVMF